MDFDCIDAQSLPSFLLRLYNIIKGITVFKIFIWGGISSDIRSEIVFYSDARAEP